MKLFTILTIPLLFVASSASCDNGRCEDLISFVQAKVKLTHGDARGKFQASETIAKEEFRVIADSANSRDQWQEMLVQLKHVLASDNKLNQEFQVGGGDGLCPSCEENGQIFEARNATTNEKIGDLNSIRLTNDPRLISLNSIHSIDEFHLGGRTPPFRWASIMCKKWFTVLCLKKESDRQNLWTRKAVSRWAPWIEPGTNAIDIGGNIGDTSLEIALFAKKTVAFEANPRAALHCMTHSMLNPDLHMKVHPVALSYVDGTMDLNVDCGGGNSGPVESSKWIGETILQVPQKRLDTFLLQEHGEDFLRNVSFIKIDTEGFDKTLLRTYKPLLKFSKPTFWVEWFNPYHENNPPDLVSAGSADLFSAIDEIGYVPYNPETMQVVTPESRNGIPDLLLLPSFSKFSKFHPES
jgi:FkbM family methyltransferase